MRRVFAILISFFVLALSITSFGTTDAKASPAQIVDSTSRQFISADQSAEFFRNCSDPVKGDGINPCAEGTLYPASSIGDSGVITVSFSFDPARTKKGKYLAVNFWVPSEMTCDFVKANGKTGTVSNTMIKKAVFLNCYWPTTEELSDTGYGG